jgi:hypothetical protein
MDVDAILASAATDSSKKSKSNVPVLTVEDKTVADAIGKFIDAKNEIATLDATKKDAQEDIVPAAQAFHSEQLAGCAKVPTTVKLMLPDGRSVDVDVAKSQYKKTGVDQEPELKKRFGDDYEDFFTKAMEIKLTAAALKDKDILAKLIKAVGQENFGKYFKVDHCLKPTDAFHNKRFTDDKVKATADEVIAEGIVTPYSPAIRA